MALKRDVYKSYRSPASLFLGYIVSLVVFVGGLEFLRFYLRDADFNWGFFNGILRFAIFAIALILAVLLFFLPTMIFGFSNNKIYRGRGFYHFINAVTWLCPLLFISLIVFLNRSDISYKFFDLFAIGGEAFFPCMVRFFWYYKIGARKCPICGLINTMRVKSTSEEKIGTRMEIRDEGTIRYKPIAYVYEERKTLNQMECSVCGCRDCDTYTYETRV